MCLFDRGHPRDPVRRQSKPPHRVGASVSAVRILVALVAVGDERALLRRSLAAVRYAVQLRHLPLRVAWFQWRARRLAWRTGDRFSLTTATRPRDLAVILKLAGQRRRIVERGTGTAWTAIALALADPRREVITYETVPLAERERYLRGAWFGRRAARTLFVHEVASDQPARSTMPVSESRP